MTAGMPTLAQLATFLSKRDWKEREAKRRLIFETGDRFETKNEVSYRVFEWTHSHGDEPVRLVLPVRPDGRTPARYMEQALSTLASIYHSPIDELLAAMLGENLDILLGIYPAGSISLSLAHDILTNLKNVVAQAANAEVDPKPHLPDARGNKIVDEVNFGHTFAGSFGFRIECPLRSSDRQIDFGSEPPRPLERRLLERLAYGFMTVDAAAKVDAVEPVCENFKRGLNGNICDALVELCELSDFRPFTFQFEWSTMFPVIEPLRGEHLSFSVTSKKYGLLKAASEEFKRMVVRPKALLKGRVTVLNSDVPPLQKGLLAHRKVTIQIYGGEYEGTKMQLEVSDADYQLALKAHEFGRFVATEGVPTQRGTHWRIEEHSGLSDS